MIQFNERQKMNKNTIIALLLIMITVSFFGSETYQKFYTEKIIKKEYKKEETKKEERKEKVENNDLSEYKEEKEIKIKDDIKEEKEDEEKTVDTIWIENKKMTVGITEMGGKIVSVKMKDYKNEETKENIEIIRMQEKGGAQLYIGGKSYNEKVFDDGIDGDRKVKVKDKEEIKLKYEKDGEIVEKIFTIEEDSYRIGLEIKSEKIKGKSINVGWEGGIVESEKQDNRQEQRVVHYYNGKNIEHVKFKNKKNEETTGFYKWIGLTSKYFLVSIVSESINDADMGISGHKVTGNEKEKKYVEIEYDISFKTVAEEKNKKYWFYVGPTKFEELKKYEEGFEKVLFPVMGFGKIFFWSEKWFPWIAEFVLWLLLMLKNIVKDYGIAILVITIISRIVTYPMTQSSVKSMNKMKEIQPKVNKIRGKYKNNPQKMNEEIMKIYRKEGVNPLNPGCLPMFLQMPIFIALFVVLRKAIELRGAETILLPWIKDLSKPEVLISLKSIIPGGIPIYGSQIALLPIINAMLMFIQNKMTIKDPNQKAMIYIMPVFILFIFNNFPSGLVLYWTLSSAIQLLQQYITGKNRK